jgi:hypothetical protein
MRVSLRLPLLAALVLTGCEGSVTGPGGERTASAGDPGWSLHAPGSRGMPHGSGVTLWNEVARQLVAAHQTSPPRASRAYALLSVAQYEALLALPKPGALEPSAVRAAVAAASALVLTELYPGAAVALAAFAEEHGLAAAMAKPWSDVAGAVAVAEAAAERVMAHARTDGWDAVWTGAVPAGPGMWFSSASPPQPPVLPLWGQVRPWLMTSGSQFRPGPPPAFGSPEFLAALEEVRHLSDHRTPEQLASALYWADGPGTHTPPGHWNKIASDLVHRYRLGELRAARVLAYLNMAVMDAGISCWDAKYEYWLIRPSQADPAITTPPGLPNFPAYTSGHSSFSGAAAVVLGHFFPAEQERLRAMAEEAAISRVYGGIHYRFDSEVALEQGHAIGGLAVARALAEHPGRGLGLGRPE